MNLKFQMKLISKDILFDILKTIIINKSTQSHNSQNERIQEMHKFFENEEKYIQQNKKKKNL